MLTYKVSNLNFPPLPPTLHPRPLPSILGDLHGHAQNALRPFGYLGDDVSGFSEILTSTDTGTRQEVLDQTYPDVIAPVKKKRKKWLIKLNIKTIQQILNPQNILVSYICGLYQITLLTEDLRHLILTAV